MTERPIIFSGAMVKALLSGTKTQTRRVTAFADYRPMWGLDGLPEVKTCDREYSRHFGRFGAEIEYQSKVDDVTRCFYPCPYGSPGSRLWVRETWGAVSLSECGDPAPLHECRIEYRADLPAGCTDGPGEWPRESYGDPGVCKWRPSIHMPRWASRLTLEICSVKVERLNAITEEDAIAEGCRGYRLDTGLPSGDMEREVSPVEEFAALWDSINGNRDGCCWADNPWVFVLSFRRVLP